MKFLPWWGYGYFLETHNHKKYISPFFFQWYFIQCVFSTEKKDNFLLLSIICSLVEENVGDLEKVVQVCYNTCKLNKY